jgi:uncharacterized protein YndB with AHSA1/START domain
MPAKLQMTRKGDRELVFTRHFDAAPDLVFLAHTQTTLIQKWLLGPPGWTMPYCSFDARVGGKYKYTWRNEAEGKEFSLSGTILEIERPRRIVNTEIFDFQEPGEPAIDTLVLTADGAGTQMMLSVLAPSVASCEAMLATGMTDGMEYSYSALDQYLLTATV